MLRVNTRISDAKTADYLWAGRQEFRPEDVAQIQTEMTRQISRVLHVLVLYEASRRAVVGLDAGLEVDECLTRAETALKGAMRADVTAEAQRWFLAALACDPRSVQALVGLARTCQHLVGNPWWGEPRAAAVASDLGREAVALALELEPANGWARSIQGMLYSAAGRLKEAAETFEQALALDKRLAATHAFAGYNAALLGRAWETLPAVERAMRLDPTDRRHSIWYCFGGFAELLLGHTDTAIALLRKSLDRNPSYGGAQLFLMTALSLTGRDSEAAWWRTHSAGNIPNTPLTPSSSSGCRGRLLPFTAPRSIRCSKKSAPYSLLSRSAECREALLRVEHGRALLRCRLEVKIEIGCEKRRGDAESSGLARGALVAHEVADQ